MKWIRADFCNTKFYRVNKKLFNDMFDYNNLWEIYNYNNFWENVPILIGYDLLPP